VFCVCVFCFALLFCLPSMTFVSLMCVCSRCGSVCSFFDPPSRVGFDSKKLEDRTLIYQLALKCSDISHTTKHKPLHLDWSRRVTTEFYAQGDQEKELKLAVSPGMDREMGSLAKGQIGFITFLCMPLYEAFATEFQHADVMLQVCLVLFSPSGFASLRLLPPLLLLLLFFFLLSFSPH
jgi:3'5'-cyclic nucleotide phosphodiesterase